MKMNQFTMALLVMDTVNSIKKETPITGESKKLKKYICDELGIKASKTSSSELLHILMLTYKKNESEELFWEILDTFK